MVAWGGVSGGSERQVAARATRTLRVRCGGEEVKTMEAVFTDIGDAITQLVAVATVAVGTILVAVLSLSAGRALAKRFLRA